LAVGSAKIASAAVTNAKIANAAITNAKIANLAVDSAKIADAAITNAKIEDAAITSAKIDDAAITNAKIEDAAITSAKIEDAAITTAKIGNAQITNAKIGNAAITSAKIGTAEVGTLKIAGNAVTVPASSFTKGSIGVSSTNVWVPVQALVIETTGSRVFVATSGSAVDGSVPVGDSDFILKAIFRLTRNNAELAQSSSPAISFSDTPTADTYTYALEMRAPYSATTTTITSPTVSNRSMFSIETKR
jgi:hypothetical protein